MNGPLESVKLDYHDTFEYRAHVSCSHIWTCNNLVESVDAHWLLDRR